MIGFIFNACLTGLNVGLYAATGSAVSLGAAMICGLMAVFCLVIEVTR